MKSHESLGTLGAIRLRRELELPQRGKQTNSALFNREMLWKTRHFYTILICSEKTNYSINLWPGGQVEAMTELFLIQLLPAHLHPQIPLAAQEDVTRETITPATVVPSP